MATVLRCDGCGATSFPPPGVLDPRVWCRKCGMLMQEIVLAPPKVCAVCNAETFPGHRVKDSRNSYYCEKCVAVLAKTNPIFAEAEKQMKGSGDGNRPPAQTVAAPAEPAEQSQPEPPALDDQSSAGDRPYQCHVCQGLFALDDVYSEPDGQVICKQCWAARR